MKSTWYSHIPDEDEKAHRKQRVGHLKEAWDILIDVLEHDLKTTEKILTSKASYDSPGWPYLQADYVGYTRKLRELIELLTIEEK